MAVKTYEFPSDEVNDITNKFINENYNKLPDSDIDHKHYRFQIPKLGRFLSCTVDIIEESPSKIWVEYNNTWSSLGIAIVMLLGLIGGFVLAALSHELVFIFQLEIPYRLLGGLVGTPISTFQYNLDSILFLGLISIILLAFLWLLSREVHSKEKKFWDVITENLCNPGEVQKEIADREINPSGLALKIGITIGIVSALRYLGFPPILLWVVIISTILKLSTSFWNPVPALRVKAYIVQDYFLSGAHMVSSYISNMLLASFLLIMIGIAFDYTLLFHNANIGMISVEWFATPLPPINVSSGAETIMPNVYQDTAFFGINTGNGGFSEIGYAFTGLIESVVNRSGSAELSQSIILAIVAIILGAFLIVLPIHAFLSQLIYGDSRLKKKIAVPPLPGSPLEGMSTNQGKTASSLFRIWIKVYWVFMLLIIAVGILIGMTIIPWVFGSTTDGPIPIVLLPFSTFSATLQELGVPALWSRVTSIIGFAPLLIYAMSYLFSYISMLVKRALAIRKGRSGNSSPEWRAIFKNLNSPPPTLALSDSNPYFIAYNFLHLRVIQIPNKVWEKYQKDELDIKKDMINRQTFEGLIWHEHYHTLTGQYNQIWEILGTLTFVSHHYFDAANNHSLHEFSADEYAVNRLQCMTSEKNMINELNNRDARNIMQRAIRGMQGRIGLHEQSRSMYSRFIFRLGISRRSYFHPKAEERKKALTIEDKSSLYLKEDKDDTFEFRQFISTWPQLINYKWHLSIFLIIALVCTKTVADAAPLKWNPEDWKVNYDSPFSFSWKYDYIAVNDITLSGSNLYLSTDTGLYLLKGPDYAEYELIFDPASLDPDIPSKVFDVEISTNKIYVGVQGYLVVLSENKEPEVFPILPSSVAKTQEIPVAVLKIIESPSLGLFVETNQGFGKKLDHGWDWIIVRGSSLGLGDVTIETKGAWINDNGNVGAFLDYEPNEYNGTDLNDKDYWEESTALIVDNQKHLWRVIDSTPFKIVEASGHLQITVPENLEIETIEDIFVNTNEVAILASLSSDIKVAIKYKNGIVDKIVDIPEEFTDSIYPYVRIITIDSFGQLVIGKGVDNNPYSNAEISIAEEYARGIFVYDGNEWFSQSLGGFDS